jgi:tRNA-specific 2-thiouridylase
VVGRHRGAYAFTVGQRRGLRLGDPAPDGRPRFVTSVDTAANTVIVGPEELLSVTAFEAGAAVWFAPLPAGGAPCSVQVRAHGRALPARAFPTGPDTTGDDGGPDGFRVELAEPLRALAAGQSAVLYDGERVIAQGTIRR